MKNIFYLFIVVMFAGCCKAEDGGDASLTIFLKHHGKIVKNHIGYPDTVMVKYRATEFPGFNVTDYDAIFIGQEGSDFVKINGLKCGKYFLFGVGVDSAGPYRVIGGQAFEIKYGERKNAFTLDLSVTE